MVAIESAIEKALESEGHRMFVTISPSKQSTYRHSLRDRRGGILLGCFKCPNNRDLLRALPVFVTKVKTQVLC